MSTDLLRQARRGDREAFTVLVEPYRGELHLLCYRMLGSLQDAEDTVQEVLLAAWLGLDGFEERSSIRTWLHRITTNRCLNALRSAARRPVVAAPPSDPLPEPSRHGEVPWLQPYPDLLLDGLPDDAPGPEARYESREAISLAFLTAVQLLPPNQRAVLVLRDVLGYRAAEAAEILGLSQGAVTGALQRARANLAATRAEEPTESAPTPASEQEQELTERFVTAFTSHDVDAVIALMADDVWLSMPPLPFEYRGAEDVRRFFTVILAGCTITRMVPTRANRQPAWGEYARDPVTGLYHCTGVLVARYSGDRICELVHFETVVAPYFGLPRVLPA